MLNKKILLFIALFIPCVSHADVVTTTFTFLSDSQRLNDYGNSAITFSADTSTGNPLGCVQFTCFTKSTNTYEYAQRVSSETVETWETWGVPSGATITSIRISSWSEFTSSALKLTTQTVTVDVISSTDAVVTTTPLINKIGVGITIDPNWNVMSAGSSRSVGTSWQSSSTGVRLRIKSNMTTTGGGGAANEIQQFDQFSLEMTYTPGTGGGGSTKSRHRIITSQ